LLRQCGICFIASLGVSTNYKQQNKTAAMP